MQPHQILSITPNLNLTQTLTLKHIVPLTETIFKPYIKAKPNTNPKYILYPSPSPSLTWNHNCLDKSLILSIKPHANYNSYHNFLLILIINITLKVILPVPPQACCKPHHPHFTTTLNLNFTLPLTLTPISNFNHNPIFPMQISLILILTIMMVTNPNASR